MLTGTSGSAGLFTVAGTTNVPNGVVHGRQLRSPARQRAALVRVSVPRSTRPGTYRSTPPSPRSRRPADHALAGGHRDGGQLKRAPVHPRGSPRRTAVPTSCPASAETACVGTMTRHGEQGDGAGREGQRRVVRLGRELRLKGGTKGTLRIKVARKGRNTWHEGQVEDQGHGRLSRQATTNRGTR